MTLGVNNKEPSLHKRVVRRETHRVLNLNSNIDTGRRPPSQFCLSSFTGRQGDSLGIQGGFSTESNPHAEGRKEKERPSEAERDKGREQTFSASLTADA